MPDTTGRVEKGRFSHLVLAADLAELAKARKHMEEVGQAAGLADARVFDLQVAVSEAVANAIEHAASRVEVAAWVLPDRLIVEITNEGVFQPGLYKDNEHRRRGLGLPLMVSLADQVHVSSLSGGMTQVSLTFFLEARGDRDSPPSGSAQGAEPQAPSVPAEIDVREVEDRYRNLVDLSPDAILVHVDGKYVFANPAAARLFGARSPAGLVGKDAIERIHPDDRELLVQRMSQVLAGAVAPPVEGRMLRLDGTPVSVEVAGSRVEFGGNLAIQVVIRDITERKKAEEALGASESRLATEDRALARLNEASSRLWGVESLKDGLEEMLDATIELLGADRGNIQLLDVERSVLLIAAQRGFEPDFLDFFREVSTAQDDACARALRSGGRTVIEDVEADPLFAPFRSVARAAGYRAVQSTPLVGRNGTPLGILSTHFCSPHRSSDQELSRLDLYARQAALYIERKQAEEARRKNEAGLARVLSSAGRLRLFEKRSPWRVLLIGVVLQVALILGLDQLGSSTRYLGIPGSWATLMGVLAAIAAGPITGMAVALAGGIAYFAFLADFGRSIAWPTVIASVLLWTLAAAVAGLAGEWVRHNAGQREQLLSHMLGEREALTDSLAVANSRLEVQNHELGVREEELQERNEELAAQAEELEAQNEDLHEAHVETARLLEEQSSLFQRLQDTLLDIPQDLPGVKFAHLYRSATQHAQVGGDFYDVFRAKQGHIGLLIGDVSGHGLEAARIATLVKDTVRAFAHQFDCPHLVLRETNRLLVEKGLSGFVSAFLGFLDPETGLFTYSSAGHPGPMLAADGQVTLLESIASPLGVYLDAAYRDSEAFIREGSLLLFYTDGITDARRDGYLFGEARLMDALQRACDGPLDALPALVLGEALEFSAGRLEDDVALLAVSYSVRTNTSCRSTS